MKIDPGRAPHKSQQVEPGAKPSSNKIDTGKKPAKKPWLFSFRFWRQIDYFGLEGRPASWFVSALGRFADCCKEDVDKFRSDPVKRDAYRFHEINWKQKGIPIQRKDIDWLDTPYLNNDTEYPFVQFHISKALGRVIGFWDEYDVFNVVLLDPHHNMQPCKRMLYKPRTSNPLPTDYHVLVSETQRVANSEWCKDPECSLRPRLLNITHDVTQPGLMLLNIRGELYDKINKLLEEGTITTLEDHLELAILQYEEEREKP